MTHRFKLLALTLAASGLAACKSGLVEEAGSSDEASFAAAYAHAYCTALGACCKDGGLVPAAGCEAMTAAQIQADMNVAKGGGATYQPGAAAACVAALAAPMAQCPSFKTPPYPPELCLAIYTNNPTPLGAKCTSRYECAAEPPAVATCFTETTATESRETCRLWIQPKAGESCAPSSSATAFVECETGLLCDPATQVCQTRPALGEPCLTGPEFGDTCATGAVCDRTGSKLCVPALAAGAACTSGEQCEFEACANGTCQSEVLAVVVAGICAPP